MSTAGATWSWYTPCSDCGTGRLYNGEVPGDAGTVTRPVLCAKCGGCLFLPPRPGRKVSAAVWWAPWTWGAVRWEWRADLAAPWKCATGLTVVPGGRS